MNSVNRLFPLAACLLLAVPWSSTAGQRNGPAILGGVGGVGGTLAERAADTTVNVGIVAKWNIISVPLIAAEMHKDTLFPSSISNAFYFDAGYVADNDLIQGKGYWLKFDTAETIPLIGTAIHRDTIDVSAGWNMVGSISDPVSVASVTTVPGGITLSNFWAFDNGYVHPASITPGEGYWVKASSAGAIVLDGGAAAAPRAASDPYSGLHTLVIEDARGMKQTLRFGDAAAKLSRAVTEMPPLPPPGIFDARFADGNWAEIYGGEGEHRFAVKVTSAAYPLTVRWEVDERDRREIMLNESINMTGRGAVVIAGEAPIGIRAGVSGVPAIYALRQNYPNPFNPATKISYDLPENAAVKLTVYDLLGRPVAVLADGVEVAGVHSVVFDATGFTSGIYFYRLEAAAFSDTKKLVVVK
ncbi:MAG TPA: T9SS type A sorting domain-containing protein [Bacteroidota bacterium]|nr:T9SS type A sorting domain-containing protein [Bacteroidota bacterium]